MRVFLAALALVPTLAHADWWLTATLASYHFERKGYNEQNYGAGLEYHHDDVWMGGFGFYENSYYRRTYYAMAIWMPIEEGNWRFGLAGGLASGYREYPVFVVVPTVSYEIQRVGFNLGVTPAFIGVQVKFKLDTP